MNQGLYTSLGIMSGTSMDGVDLAIVEFTVLSKRWKYRIVHATTIAYPDEWMVRLKNMHTLEPMAFWKAHVDYGHYLGKLAKDFIHRVEPKPQLICSHGHTIFHQPESGFTMQAGDGASIAAETNLPVISDFRAADLALGGQGAPLVPIGDEMLFSEYQACLNIGGFCNVSMEIEKDRVAYDICPANIVMNLLARKIGKEFDEGGRIASTGKLDTMLLKRLNSLAYYSYDPPKSLGREWVESEVFPLLLKDDNKIPDLLRTFVEHIGLQIGTALNRVKKGKVLVTGGGAHNSFLVKTISKCCNHEIIVPDVMTVNYKEALIFALLGVLRWTGEINVLSSVTGSSRDHSGGSVFHL